MAAIELKLDDKALARLRATDDVVAEVERIAGEWLNEANDTLPEGVGYRMATHIGSSRKRGPYVVSRVYTSSNHAKNSNAVHNTLARIVGK